MIVLEGRNGKSVKLVNLIKKDFRTEKVVVIDTVGVESLTHLLEGYDVLTVGGVKEPNEIIAAFEEEYDNVFKKYDWVAFYVNAPTDTLETFRELDRKYPQNFIVTIQNNNGLTSLYYY